jgi:hypothetical protein
VPGGVAAVPLAADAGALPARIAVTVGGLRTSAPVVRVAAGGPASARHWTRSPERIVAWMASEQAPASIEAAAADAFAMVELPASGEGDLEVDGVEEAVRGIAERGAEGAAGPLDEDVAQGRRHRAGAICGQPGDRRRRRERRWRRRLQPHHQLQPRGMRHGAGGG